VRRPVHGVMTSQTVEEPKVYRGRRVHREYASSPQVGSRAPGAVSCTKQLMMTRSVKIELKKIEWVPCGHE
jgi:hypothetical protein